MRKLTVTLAFCGSTFAAGLPSAMVTPVVVRIRLAAGGICFITVLSTGLRSRPIEETYGPHMPRSLR